ncbi:MAG: two-component system, NarL family, sensor kinase [Solirubrobacteraceae bacterium]|nr:two-component system, NarL family, sensor kinase [Solirubrobacteraceae bacterium]
MQLAVSSLAILILVGAIGAVTLKHLATGEALSDARSVTVAFSRGVLRKQVTPAVLRGDPAALRRLDRTVHEAVLGHPIVRVKVWAPDGRIVYSDARELIGQRFPLPHDLREALADDAVRADVTDLSRPENRLERGRGRLVEVYLPLRLGTGERVMVEAYHPGERIDAASRRVWRTFLPMMLGVLLALAIGQLPLVWAQGRRARADAREREALAREAERSLHDERGRIATELHEGIVQDLAGAAYALHAAATLPDGASERDLRGALGHGADVCRRSMTRMRELLVDLRSTEHRVQDLQGAMDALAQPLRANGVEVIVGIAVDGAIEGDAALLMHRAAREILLEVRRHADVSLATVGLAERGSDVTLTVDHNMLPAADGHAGRRSDDPRARLRSLADRLEARGGSLAIDAMPGLGVRYTATLPAEHARTDGGMALTRDTARG